MNHTTSEGHCAPSHTCVDPSSHAQVSKVAFRNHVRCYRAERKLSLQGLASLSGYSAKHLRRLELGYFVPLATNLWRLAVALGVTVDDLLDHGWLRANLKPPPACSPSPS